MLELKRMPSGKPAFLWGGTHTHTIGKSPNQRTEKLSFVSQRFFLLRAIDNEERERPQKRKGFRKKSSCEKSNWTHSYRATKKDKYLDPKSSCHSYTKEIAVERTFRGFCTL